MFCETRIKIAVALVHFFTKTFSQYDFDKPLISMEMNYF